jgi:AraC family transcriptional regulator of adaptative response/methylated-DNA-[protein]-cysteine methyltransferase
MVGAVREVLDAADEPLDLATLAERVGSSPFHLHRLFKKHVGMTPRQYAAAVRLRRVEKELGKGASVTSAIHRAGYSSSSRFYESESGALGMLPSGVRRGGAGVEMMAVARSCSLGRVLVATTSRGVCAILLGDDPKRLFADLERRFPHATVRTGDASTKAIAARVVKMIDTGIVATNLPLDLIGTAFQQRVWRALRDIPPGATTTYGEIAERIGARFAARAVGTACGQNPLAVVVPCHRVLRSDGGLGGYRWGIGRKTKLLGRERPK